MVLPTFLEVTCKPYFATVAETIVFKQHMYNIKQQCVTSTQHISQPINFNTPPLEYYFYL